MSQIKGELFGQQFIPKLLDGTKIRTSRPIKPQPELTKLSRRWVWPIPKSKVHKGCCTEVCTASREWWQYLAPDQFPYQAGDILWVRETWQKWASEYHYKADFNTDRDMMWTQAESCPKWRPSIHMPREAARIFLRITDVKAQRIDGLTEQDAIEDGFTPIANESDGWTLSALDQCKAFWVKQYGSNVRWMWVYYLKLISKEEAYEH